MQGEALKTETVAFFSDLNPRTAKKFLRESAQAQVSDDEDANKPDVNALGFKLVDDTFQPVSKPNQLQDSVLWLDLSLCKALVRAVTHLGYMSPTPVQAKVIPEAIRGTDLCVRAVTGSGKTASFLLPMLDTLLTKPSKKQSLYSSKRKYIRALVMVPSRELGVQCHKMAEQLMQFSSSLTVSLAIGGVASKAQEAALDQAPDLVIATPGRLCDLLRNYRGVAGKGNVKGIDLSGCEFVVLDECDKMLSGLLRDQVEDILTHTDDTIRQMLLVSATMTSDVDDFAKKYLFKPKSIDIGHVALASQLKQQFIRIQTAIEDVTEEDALPEEVSKTAKKDGRANRKRRRNGQKASRSYDSDDSDVADDDEPRKGNSKSKKSIGGAEEEQDGVRRSTVDNHISKIKSRYLVAICQSVFKDSVLIFTKFRTTAHRLNLIFKFLGLRSVELQGNQPQEERFASIKALQDGVVQFMFCTDVASRGLDIKGVNVVINFDLPPNLTTYIHRVGRTARIGDKGIAVSLVHEVQDAEIMRKIITISSQINSHQISSVKRRNIPPEILQRAKETIDDVFHGVKDILAAEELEAKITTAEKRAMNSRDIRAVLDNTLTAEPKKTWCLTKEETRVRAKEARAKYLHDTKVVTAEIQEEMNELEKQENRFLQKKKDTRAAERDKKGRAREKELASIKEKRKKYAEKLQGGVVKKHKKAKIRTAKAAQRADSRKTKGISAFKRSSKATSKKSRHKGRMKKH